jgi:mono/diheme cytochrome c family protein/plastocyanin
MKHSEGLTRLIIAAITLGAVGIPLILWSHTSLLHAHVAEAGGWSPDALQAKVGVPFHLRLTSDDVMHGFAVGQMDMDAVDVLPGKVTDLTLLFDHPGTYTFFCTRWCGLNHWRMRGTIEVSGGAMTAPPLTSAPLYVTLGLDIDAPHDAPIVPSQEPSAIKGKQLAAEIRLAQFADMDYYSSHSPLQSFEELDDPSLTDAQRWDLVALIWESNTSAQALAHGEQLYAQNCAACHGETGAGDGVFADDLGAAGDASAQPLMGANTMTEQNPADLTDPGRILGASPALLQGKILRGGMGTGMPMWGSIFTEEETWDLVAYLYSFQFEYR